MQVKISPPAASPVKRHGSVTFCTTDFTATKCPPCRHPPSRRGWQHFNMRAQSLAFPNFSLAKHLSLHPATKLWQVPRASRPLSCENTNGTVRPGLYGRGDSPRLYPYSPPDTPPPVQHTQAMLKNTRSPRAPLLPSHRCLRRTKRCPQTSSSAGGLRAKTDESDLGTVSCASPSASPQAGGNSHPSCHPRLQKPSLPSQL